MTISNSGIALGTVLVTGGCGFVGGHIVRALLKEETCSSVVVVSRNPASNHQEGAEYHTGDITNTDQMSALLDKVQPRVIIHTAAVLDHEKPSVTHHINVEGTGNLLKCAASNLATEASVYTSSDSAVVPSPHILNESVAQLYEESSRVNAYARSKATADKLILAANDKTKLRTTCLRIPAIYGEGDTNVTVRYLDVLRKGHQSIQIRDNSKEFEFLYVTSAASVHVLTARGLLCGRSDPQAPKVDGEAFFVTDDKRLLLWDFARKI